MVIPIKPKRIKGRPIGEEIWLKRWGGSKSNSGPSGYQTKHSLGRMFSSLYQAWKAKGRNN